jgi:hypothetical protein
MLKNENTLYQITSSDNQNNNRYDNVSTIALGKCEEILKKNNNISLDRPLLIFKIDYFQPGTLIPIIGYEIFHPDTKQKLNLKDCKDNLINFNIPVSIDENNLFKYDPENEYYKDECYPSTTDNGTDIIINDRQEEFNDKNLSLCENNCSYNGYDDKNKKSKCECKIKSKQLVISDIMNQADLLNYNFTSKSGSLNMVTMKCYYTLFTKDGLITNIGSYIIVFTTILFGISSIIFYKCGFNILEDNIKELIESKEEKHKDKNNGRGKRKEKNIDKDVNIYKNIKKKKTKKKKKKKKKNIIKSI